MYRYQLQGDFTLFASGDTEFVKRVYWRSRFAEERTWYDFMIGWAKRLYKGNRLKKMPRTMKPSDFVNSLIDSGILTKNIMN